MGTIYRMPVSGIGTLDNGYRYRYHTVVDKLLEQVGRNPKNVRFADLRKLCDRYFGEPRQHGSHLIYNTPWPGQPRVNIQSSKGMAKPYQVLKAITRLEETA